VIDYRCRSLRTNGEPNDKTIFEENYRHSIN